MAEKEKDACSHAEVADTSRLPGVDRVEVEEISYLGIEKQHQEVFPEQIPEKIPEQIPEKISEAFAAASFGPQGAEERVEHDCQRLAPELRVHLPVLERKRSLTPLQTELQNELMQKSHLVVRGLHPGIQEVAADITDKKAGRRVAAGAYLERRGGIPLGPLPGCGGPRKFSQKGCAQP